MAHEEGPYTLQLRKLLIKGLVNAVEDYSESHNWNNPDLYDTFNVIIISHTTNDLSPYLSSQNRPSNILQIERRRLYLRL